MINNTGITPEDMRKIAKPKQYPLHIQFFHVVYASTRLKINEFIVNRLELMFYMVTFMYVDFSWIKFDTRTSESIFYDWLDNGATMFHRTL